jgi:hypothetical protein
MYAEAKDHATKLGPREIKIFMESVNRNAEPTFGVFITSRRHGYSSAALAEARGSIRDILLTNIFDMNVDIPAYTFKRKTFMQTAIAQETKALQDKIDGLEDSIEAMQDSIETTHMMLPEINRKLAFIEKKIRESQKKQKDDLNSFKISINFNFIITNVIIIFIFLILINIYYF